MAKFNVCDIDISGFIPSSANAPSLRFVRPNGLRKDGLVEVGILEVTMKLWIPFDHSANQKIAIDHIR